MMQIERVGQFRVVRVERHRQNAPRGMRTGWTEYQVREGRRVVSRHERLIEAMDAARAALDAHWDAIAAEVKAWRASA